MARCRSDYVTNYIYMTSSVCACAVSLWWLSTAMSTEHINRLAGGRGLVWNWSKHWHAWRVSTDRSTSEFTHPGEARMCKTRLTAVGVRVCVCVYIYIYIYIYIYNFEPSPKKVKEGRSNYEWMKWELFLSSGQSPDSRNRSERRLRRRRKWISLWTRVVDVTNWFENNAPPLPAAGPTYSRAGRARFSQKLQWNYSLSFRSDTVGGGRFPFHPPVIRISALSTFTPSVSQFVRPLYRPSAARSPSPSCSFAVNRQTAR